MSVPPDPPPGPAEGRLDELLEVLRDAPEVAEDFTDRIVGTAHWQRLVRSAVDDISDLGASLFGLLPFIFGRRPTR